MRLPWRRNTDPHPSEESKAAIEQARRTSRDVDRLAERVDEVAAEIARIRARNHFAAAFMQAIQRKVS